MKEHTTAAFSMSVAGPCGADVSMAANPPCSGLPARVTLVASRGEHAFVFSMAPDQARRLANALNQCALEVYERGLPPV